MIHRLFPTKSRKLYFIVFNDINILDFSGPLQVFSSANKFIGWEYYKTRIISNTEGSITTNSGVKILTTPLGELDEDEVVDTIIICGGSGAEPASRDSKLIEWIKTKAARVQRVVSICSGAFVLAESGLLDRCRATTHWSVCDKLSRKYPTVSVEEDSIYVNDGNVWTSAGVTAGIDLCLALVEQDTNHKISLNIAKDLVLFLRRQGGQSQFSENLSVLSHDKRMTKIYDWVIDNLSTDINLEALASAASISERSLARLCNEITGLSPFKMVTKIRMEIAKSHLDSTNTPIKSIAISCGFKNEINFRRAFIKTYNITPISYRKRFM